MAGTHQLEAVFKSFCSFGAGKDEALMDSTKCSKLFRDLKLYGKNLTETDVDIAFNKVKAKTERKINFKQFQELLKVVAEQYKSDKRLDEGDDALKALIEDISFRQTPAQIPGASAGTDRVVGTSKYTVTS